MAESAQACVETFTELYNLIKETQLFSSSELRLMGVKRRDFEHGIKMVGDSAEEQYVRYISYDWDMINLVEQKKKEKKPMDERMEEKIDQITVIFQFNLNQLFKALLKRYPRNLKHWAWYLKFCKTMKMYNASHSMCERLVKIHEDKPIAFSIAAEWTLMRTFNYEMARTFILQGLHTHKDSHDLYLDLLKNELEFTAMLREKYGAEPPTGPPDKLRDDLIEGAICKLVYLDAKNSLGINLKTVPLFKRMIDLMRQYDFTKQFQDDIISDVLKEMPKCELFHDLVAKSHLVTKQDPTTAGTPYPMDEMLDCYTAYCDLEKTCNTEAMWSLRLDFVDDMMKQTTNSIAGNEIKQWYLSSSDDAHRDNKLSVKQYITRMDILQKDDQKELFNFLLLYIRDCKNPRLSKSPDIWLYILKCKISMQEDDKQIFELFKKGIQVLEKNSLPLFLTALNHFSAIDKDITRKIFNIGFGQEFCAYPEICNTMRVKYLEWLVLTYNREKAYEFYKSVWDKPPFSRELHQLMYKLCWSGGEITIAEKERMVQILDRAQVQFGRTNVDVWLDKVRHDILYSHGVNKDKIIWHARTYLQGSTQLLEQFDKKLLTLPSLDMDDDQEPPSMETAGSGLQVYSHTPRTVSEFNSMVGGQTPASQYSAVTVPRGHSSGDSDHLTLERSATHHYM